MGAMNGPVGFYALGAAWLLALLVPLIAFYFLKLKRTRVLVSSLVLWRQVLADRRVNSPFQRFKRNILLLLQALLLIALALAAMQPFWRGRESRIERRPILIDCSASMAALDKPGGVTRIEEAKAEAGRLIDALLPGEKICLITVGRSARKRIGFSDDKAALREALRLIRVEDVPGDLEDALRLAQALAQGEPFEEALLLSDGNVPMETHFDLPFRLNYQRLAPGGPNAGITSLNARRSLDGRWEVFTTVESSSEDGSPATLTIERDGETEPVARRTLSPAPDRPEQLLAGVPGDRPSRVRLTLRPEGPDSLESDNAAVIDLPVARPLLAYCSAELRSYRHALDALPYADVYPRAEATPPAAYDLLITDNAADLATPAATVIAVGVVPEDAAALLKVDREGTQAIDWQRNHPLLQHVELGDALFLDRVAYVSGAKEADFDALGYDILVHGREGPLLLERRRDDVLEYYFLFHTDRTTLPYRVGFPILVANVAATALERAGISRVDALTTGVFPPRPWPADEPVRGRGDRPGFRHPRAEGGRLHAPRRFR
jgi:hypothetical protein